VAQFARSFRGLRTSGTDRGLRTFWLGAPIFLDGFSIAHSVVVTLLPFISVRRCPSFLPSFHTFLTSRQSQRPDLSRSVLSHGSRQVVPWLIFDVGPLRTLSMRRKSESSTPAKVLKQTSAEPLACSVRQACALKVPRGFRHSDRAAARTLRCQQRSRSRQRRALVRHFRPVQPSCFRSLLPRSARVFRLDPVFRAVARSLHFQRGIAQQGARANAGTCHGSCCACSAPVPVVAHL